MKRLVSLLLVFSIMLTLVPATVFAEPSASEAVEIVNPFADVKENDWFYDAVQYARINGFFNGTTETTFAPNGTMTRGMFVTVLGRMAGVDTAAYKGQAPFKDVPANMYYAPYVAWAAKHGVTSGMGDGTFVPDGLINREQMATFFVRYFEEFDIDYSTGENIITTPADMKQVSSWAQEAVKSLWKQGLLNGDGTNFNPKADATRAQTAAIAQRTDDVVETWYKEPGIASDRVKINPETGLAFDEKEQKTEEKKTTRRRKASAYSINFYDGDTLIDTLYADRNKPLGEVPAVEKSSKLNAILLGYYLDPEFTQPFYAEEPVTGNMKVYAKYEEMGSTEELNFTSFAQMDQEPNVTFEVVGSGNPETAVTLEVIDGSDPVTLDFEETDGGYIVSAPSGFNKGASYQLHLADGWTFKDKPDTIRTASFSIAMEEIDNIEMNNEIKYIEDTDAIDYTVGGQSHDVLTSSLVTETGGSFEYDGDVDVETGDIICVYVGVHPEEREGNEDVLDPAIYVKVKSISGDTITFEPLGEEEQMQLYDIPDNFPIKVDTLPTEETGTVNISKLDTEMYAMMMGEGYDLAKAKEAISVGDFISLFVSSDNISSENDIYFGEVTAYNSSTGEITYKKTTTEAIETCMDLYSEVEIEGSDVVTEEEKEEIEQVLLAQVEESGFAEEAAFMLADIATETDGFKNNSTIQEFIVKDANGNELSDEQLELLNLGSSFEISDDIKLTVELITEGEQLHFNSGVQLAIGISAEFEVELESEDKINIELSATFVQEVMIDPKVKGNIVKKKILFIPVPVGVKVGATIDIKSFTAFSFNATIYTVAADDELGWKSFKEMAKKELKNLGIQLPEELVEGAKTVKELVAKAKELEKQAKEIQGKIDAFEGSIEQANKYMADAASIYSALEANGINWKTMEEAFGATNVASDLMDMMNLTNETGLTTEYYDSVQALMDRYCEMLEQESDWITLVEEQMFAFEVNAYGLVLGVSADFVVRADMSLAIGSNIEYEVGKRYEFWFKIGLFKPTAGNSTMDLIDERFAFQFYVMGRLGLRAGVKAKIYVALGTGDFASAGIFAELGPYVKLYGFFVYEYTKHRPANTNNWISDERMMGALFMEFGLYFVLGFEAEALKLFEYSYDFLDEEIPLLKVGKEKYYYQFDYEPEEDESVRVNDVDNNSANGITMEIPETYFGLRFVNLQSGFMAVEALDFDKYIFNVSNPNFTFDNETGIISVNVPDGERYMECDLTATYKHGKLAFSTYDMSVTIPLVWTSLSDQELSEYYTASVRVGNDNDGYQTVWTKKVLKGQTFDLPTEDEIKEIIGWNEYKYEMGTGYGSQQLEGLTLIDNAVYDFDVDYKTYSITVEDVENADGSKSNKTFTAKFGETFDFSTLKETGTVDYDDSKFTAFSELTAPEGVDLTKAIDKRMAETLKNGVTAKANYIDNSVKATFVFTGIDHDDVEMSLRRGDTPSLTDIEIAVDEKGMAILDIYPAVAPMTASATYQVICGELTGPDVTIIFIENDGSDIEDITKVVGSLIGTLPTPERTGYEFEGWYTDEQLTTEFEATKMPEGGATLYAKWSAKEYTVTFNVNGGNDLEVADRSKTVTYGETYGALPVPTKSGSGFVGWFTAKSGGDEVTAETNVSITENQTLYARWKELETIPESAFNFADADIFTYEKGVGRTAEYTLDKSYNANEFTFKYKRQGNNIYEAGLPVNAGTYDVIVSRPADNTYAKFEAEYHAVLIINKAVRAGSVANVGFVKSGLNYMELELLGDDGGIYDLNEDASIIFNVTDESGNVFSSKANENVVYNIEHSANKFATSVTVVEPNYEDWTSTPVESNFTLEAAPTTSWLDYADTSWYNDEDTEFTLTTAAELAGLSYLVNISFPKKSMAGKTIKLGNDIDLREHIWTEIGYNSSWSFEGVFDGQGHTISGVYTNAEKLAAGLFGYIQDYNTSDDFKTAVKNVVLDDSFIYGEAYVGGIVGYAVRAEIENCTSYAYVKAGQMSSEHNYISAAGGIVGYLSDGTVMNCVNYGTISAKGRLDGGIVGDSPYSGKIINNVNFGSVTGSSRVGGIVGATDTSDGSTDLVIYNNYNAGTVRPRAGSNDYIGAIVGRNTNDNGVVQYNYYLQDCAVGGDGKSRYALGKEGGSVIDGTTSAGQTYYASSFENLDSQMNVSAGTYSGKTLIEALNSWVKTESGNYDDIPEAWTATGPDGYPLPENSLTSALRK